MVPTDHRQLLVVDWRDLVAKAIVMNGQQEKVEQLAQEAAALRQRIAELEEERKAAQRALLQGQDVLRQLLTAYDRERQLIAEDIHDGLARQLAAAATQFERCDRLEKEGKSGASNAFADGVSLIRQSLEEVRDLMAELRTVVLKDKGVVAAIEEFAAHAGGGAQAAKVEFVHDVRFGRLPAPLEKAILQIVREGVTSAIGRGKGERIVVRLVEAGDRLQIEIQDWGVGFDPAAPGPGFSAWEGIQERARLLGGRALAESEPGRGTKISVDLPLAMG